MPSPSDVGIFEQCFDVDAGNLHQVVDHVEGGVRILDVDLLPLLVTDLHRVYSRNAEVRAHDEYLR